jgi:hypothetical protein
MRVTISKDWITFLPTQETIVFRGETLASINRRGGVDFIFQNGIRRDPIYQENRILSTHVAELGNIDSLPAYPNGKSAFVSTSKDLSVSKDFTTEYGNTRGWVFEIEPMSGNVIDTLKTLEENKAHKSLIKLTKLESEVSFIDNVPSENIISAFKVNELGYELKGTRKLNPRYNE